MVVYRQSAPSDSATSRRRDDKAVLVELTISWEDRVIRVEHLQPNQRFVLQSVATQDGPTCVMDPPEVLQDCFPWTLIEPGAHGVSLMVPPGSKYRVCPMDADGEDAQQLWPERDSHTALGVELSEQELVQCQVGKFRFAARLLAHHPLNIGRFSIDKPMRNSLLASLIAVTATLASTFAFAGERPAELEQPANPERLAELISISTPTLTPREAADFVQQTQQIERIQRVQIDLSFVRYGCGCGTTHSEQNPLSLPLFDLLGPNRVRAIDAYQHTMRRRDREGLYSLKNISSQTNPYAEYHFLLDGDGPSRWNSPQNTLAFGAGSLERIPYWLSGSGRGWSRYGDGGGSAHPRPRHSAVNIQGKVTGDPVLARDLAALTRQHRVELTDCFDTARDYEPTNGGSLRVQVERFSSGGIAVHTPSSARLHSEVVRCTLGVLSRLPYLESTERWSIDFQVRFSIL